MKLHIGYINIINREEPETRRRSRARPVWMVKTSRGWTLEVLDLVVDDAPVPTHDQDQAEKAFKGWIAKHKGTGLKKPRIVHS